MHFIFGTVTATLIAHSSHCPKVVPICSQVIQFYFRLLSHEHISYGLILYTAIPRRITNVSHDDM